MTLECNDARTLVPAYQDGELSEAQAAPLRRHLLDCCDCRLSAQSARDLTRWFAPGRALAMRVPSGFAARVARRAFAGDPGLVAFGAEGYGEGVGAALPQGRVLSFVLTLTATAAAAMLVAALALGSRDLPRGSVLQAEQGVPPTANEVEAALRELEAQEAAEALPGTGHTPNAGR